MSDGRSAVNSFTSPSGRGSTLPSTGGGRHGERTDGGAGLVNAEEGSQRGFLECSDETRNKEVQSYERSCLDVPAAAVGPGPRGRGASIGEMEFG